MGDLFILSELIVCLYNSADTSAHYRPKKRKTIEPPCMSVQAMFITGLSDVIMCHFMSLLIEQGVTFLN